MRVLVVTGGNSDEREISLMSAANVFAALKKNGHTVTEFDFRSGLRELKKILSKIDVVFPVLHGVEGEGGGLQLFLEKEKIKFVGSGSAACKKTWNKLRFKEFCASHGIVTTNWRILTRGRTKDLKRAIPFVIKPTESGSSVDVWILKTQQDLSHIDFNVLFSKYKEVMIEDYINGVEITVGILDGKTLPVIEIRPPKGEWFSYENKYNGRTQEIPFAPSLSQKQQKKAQRIALRLHKELKCKSFSRTDFILGVGGILYVLELNTIPGLTKESLLPKAAKAAGIPFEEMVEELINMTFKNSGSG